MIDKPSSMDVSRKTLDRLKDLSDRIALILRKKHVSPEQTILILLECCNIDEYLSRLILEEMKT